MCIASLTPEGQALHWLTSLEVRAGTASQQICGARRLSGKAKGTSCYTPLTHKVMVCRYTERIERSCQPWVVVTSLCIRSVLVHGTIPTLS